MKAQAAAVAGLLAMSGVAVAGVLHGQDGIPGLPEAPAISGSPGPGPRHSPGPTQEETLPLPEPLAPPAGSAPAPMPHARPLCPSPVPLPDTGTPDVPQLVLDLPRVQCPGVLEGALRP